MGKIVVNVGVVLTGPRGTGQTGGIVLDPLLNSGDISY